MLDEGVEPYVLAGELGGVVAVELAAALGGANMDPVGGSIGASRESVGVDKGLEQYGSVAVAVCPVVTEPASGHPEELGGEVLALDPRQDEEACVVDDEVEVALSLGVGPTDPTISGGELPRGGGKAKEGHYLVLRSGEVAQLGSRERAVAAVVVAGDVFVPQVGLGAGRDEVEVEVGELVDRGGERGAGVAGRGAAAVGAAIAVAVVRKGEGDQAVAFHAEHGDAAGHVLAPAVEAYPSELVADQARELGAVAPRVGGDEVADAVEFLGGEEPAAVAMGGGRVG